MGAVVYRHQYRDTDKASRRGTDKRLSLFMDDLSKRLPGTCVGKLPL